MECSGFHFSRHAVERMFQRGIAPDVVEYIVGEGEIIATYPDDKPFASALLLGFDSARPVRVVVARDAATGLCYVVTVYRPDPDVWTEDFKRRRTP